MVYQIPNAKIFSWESFILYKIKSYQLPYYNKWTLGSSSNYAELNIDPILNRFRSHFNDILLKAIHTLKKKFLITTTAINR